MGVYSFVVVGVCEALFGFFFLFGCVVGVVVDSIVYLFFFGFFCFEFVFVLRRDPPPPPNHHTHPPVKEILFTAGQGKHCMTKDRKIACGNGRLSSGSNQPNEGYQPTRSNLFHPTKKKKKEEKKEKKKKAKKKIKKKKKKKKKRKKRIKTKKPLVT